MRNLTYSFFYVIPPVSQSGTRNSFLLRPTKTPHSTLCIAAKIEFQILSLSLLPLTIPLCVRIFAVSNQRRRLKKLSLLLLKSKDESFQIPYQDLELPGVNYSRVWKFCDTWKYSHRIGNLLKMNKIAKRTLYLIHVHRSRKEDRVDFSEKSHFFARRNRRERVNSGAAKQPHSLDFLFSRHTRDLIAVPARISHCFPAQGLRAPVVVPYFATRVRPLGHSQFRPVPFAPWELYGLSSGGGGAQEEGRKSW